MATLFVVATPIGNLEDITLRALRVLKEVDLVLCEDTRVTRKLLSHYQIPTPTMSYHTHSTDFKVERILELLKEGKNLAVVSDAGTPGISDPGSMLVKDIREKLPEVKIEAVAGPSALAAAVSISGVLATDFVFLGFLPHKKGRETLFKALASLQKHFMEAGQETRKVIIAREITKMFEQVISGTPQELLTYCESNPDKVRGEYVILVEGR